MRLAAALFLLFAFAAPASACTLAFTPSFQAAPGRIAAIDLAIKHGAVIGMRSILLGWQITINNDPSWVTKIDGRAIVGAAFLEPFALSKLFLIKPEPGRTCSELGMRGFLKLKLKFYFADKLQDTTVNRSSIVLAD